METLGEGENEASVNRLWDQLPFEEDPSQFLGQTSGMLEADNIQGITLNSEGQMTVMGDSSLQPASNRLESLQLELQDSCLSPALSLIPQGKAFLPSEFTLLHQTDLEFFPLSGSPDLSNASERCPPMSHLDVDGKPTHRSHEEASLSQHHLGTMSAILEDASSCCSLSQHSLSPNSNYQATQNHENSSSLDNNDERQKEGKLEVNADLDGKGSLSSDISVCSFQKLLEKDLGVASSKAPSSSKAVLSQTETVLRLINTCWSQVKDSAPSKNHDPACKSTQDPQLRPSEGREQPQGSSSSLLSQRTTMGIGNASLSTRLSAVSNITVRSTNKQTHGTVDLPVRQFQPHSESSLAALGSTSQTENNNTPVGQNIPSTSGVHTTGLQRALRSSGSNQAADGSFLPSQPVFQSTPAVLLGRGAPAAAIRFPVYSHQEMMLTSTQNNSPKPDDFPALTLNTTSHQSNFEVTIATSLEPGESRKESHLQHEILHGHGAPSPVLDVPVIDEDASLAQPTLATLPHTSDQQLKDTEPRLSKGTVHSIPTLSYVQKVDAWKANQSSSSSFYGNMSFQGEHGVHPKSQVQDSVPESLKQQHITKTSSISSANSNTPPTLTGGGVLSSMDVEVAGGAGGSTSPSLFTQSNSHSSHGTVITPIQPDGLQQNQTTLAHTDDACSPGSTEAKSSPSLNVMNNQSSTNDSGTRSLNRPALPSADQYSGINVNNMCNIVSSFQASVGAASSVVSLELDNYAPYWTSRPESPQRSSEFNIEDRIPLYLHNLGIDQSPSAILNPFTHRGPIREPEFSPTDLCTIKGSAGTPTKSMQPSDGDRLQKESLSSVLSEDSSPSLTQSFIQQPASSDSRRMADFQTHTPPEPHSLSDSVPQRADTSLREGSYGLSTDVSLKSVPKTWESVEAGDSSLVGSGTLQEIRQLLGHAENLSSTHFSVASFPESHSHSESEASFLSLSQSKQTYHDDSFLSVDGKISSVLAHSSSDSALKESSSSSSGLLELSISGHMNKGPLAPSLGREENPKSRDFCVAPRRAEPEGCSAADPDKIGPARNPPLTSDGQQQRQTHTKNAGVISSNISPTHSQTEAEMCVLSDASSEHSLASRVAKLLHSESSASVVTSQSSTAEPDESRARDWIMMKVSGAKCEALELDAEDRRRIEEIKRELLLHTKYTKSSSESESGRQSTVGTVPQPAVGFAALHSAEDRLSEQLQQVSEIPFDSSLPLHTPQEGSIRQTGIKETRNSLTVSHCLHTHNSHPSHNGIVLESNSYTSLSSSEEWKPQTQLTKSVTNNEVGKGRVGKKKEMRAEDAQTVREMSHCVDSERKVSFPPGLESGSALGQKPCFSSSHFTPTMKLQQSTDQRPRTPASDFCSYPELLTESHTHLSDSLNTSIEVPLPVYSTKEERQVPVTSGTSLCKDGNADQIQNSGIVNGHSQMTSRYPQVVTATKRLPGPSTLLLVNTTAIPTLLPYKPHGSSELFYMPQTVPELSPNCSDTTVESSHPGSDDAVPPHFTPEVLGSRELMDNSITPKHKEGIYSKREKIKRESTITGKGFHDQRDNIGLPNQHRKSVEQVAEPTKEGEAFTPLPIDADNSTSELPLNHRVQNQNMETETLPSHPTVTREKGMKVQNIGAEIGSSLDQLWHRFNEQYSLQESSTTNDLEISLLERLERLSRLLQSTSPAPSRVEKGKSRRREHELRRTQETDTIIKGTEKARSELKGIPKPKTAWEKESSSTKETLVEREQREKDYRYPAERDESASVSLETSSSQSTIDTQRLIRAFGPHRVSSGREGVAGGQTLKLSDDLLKRHNTFTKQKRGQGKEISENRLVSVSTETSNTDDSMASDTFSSSSSYAQPSQRCTSGKRAKLKLVSRSIQAGDLEIVVNGTRKDTRDVGTTFPSPSSSRALRAGSTAPVQSQPVLRKQAPNGLLWFVSADELKWDARKENNPQRDAGQSEGQAWFEPNTRTQPWREPLRERHLQVEIVTPPVQNPHSANDRGSKPSALVRLSLQEALELHRPAFVSRSRERMKRLCLLVEERKMQAVFNKEREELFNRPTAVQQPKAAPAPPSKRIIPVNEMIQRSKRIYAKLPEVQKRKEEDRRKAQYTTYRLNAQLFNKKITNRLLGRRAPWQ